ncbi:hypothetical protein KW506_06020 [Vibrio fluvialis]|nr:hypothetical protein [Vibrio fluvialis]
MDSKDLLYIAGAVMPHDRIKRNDASYNAGFLVSKFYTDQEQAILESGVIKNLPIFDRILSKKSKRQLDVELRTESFKRLNFRSEHDREAAARIAGKHRLVKGRKSPTENFRHRKERQIQSLRLLGKVLRPKSLISSPEAYFNHDVLYDTAARSTPHILNQNGKRAKGEPKKIPVSMNLMHREWDNTFKFQAITETPPSAAPDANTGERFTEKLSGRSVRKIFEAAAYTAACHDGFTTFLTLTFTKAQRLALFGGMTDGENYLAAGPHHPIQYKRNMVTTRAKKGEKKVGNPIVDIAGEYWTVPNKDRPAPKVMNKGGLIAGDYCDIKSKPEHVFTMEKTLETSIGNEVSRFLDAAKKLYLRGWVADHTRQSDPETGAPYSDLTKVKVPKHVKAGEFGPTQEPADFHYIWVAECPENEDGEPNPHIHVLLRWSVPHRLFSAWSKRLEKIWGHGFAKLERIRKPQAAGSYIIKAVGYAAKGEDASQGLIKGNRYGVAKCSRAPDWKCLASFDADNMTAIIKELGYKLEQWKRPLKRQANKLHAAKAQTIKAHAIAKQQSKPQEYRNKLQQRIIRLEKQAEKLNKTVRSRGVHISTTNRFCITFEGEGASLKVDKFLLWAAGARGWPMHCRDFNCEDIKQEADVMYAKHFCRFKDKRSYWNSVLRDNRVIEDVDEAEISYWHSMREEARRYTPMC